MTTRLNLTSDRLHRLFLANMAVGLAVFAAAIYFMITGEYESLLARQQHEALLNKFAIGGLFYVAATWYLDQFFRPMLGADAKRAQ